MHHSFQPHQTKPGGLVVDALRCEYQQDPIGLGVARPRLSWQLVSGRRGVRQKAYHLRVATAPDLLAANAADLWDSGLVHSDQSQHVEYAGSPLCSGQRAHWNVCVWDTHGDEAVSAPVFWETGLLTRDQWKGRLIGGSLAGSRWVSPPCPFLRTSFCIDKPVARARLYVTAHGLFKCSINGAAVSVDRLCPGWTDYHQKLYYHTYDVGALLGQGENVVGAVLGDGWYCGHIEFRGREMYGAAPALLAQLEVQYSDGSRQVIATDETWKHAYGALLYADLLMGEAFDARRQLAGWDAPGFDDAGWAPVQVAARSSAALVAAPLPVRPREQLRPVAPPRKIAGRHAPAWLFDLGQNMVGVVRLTMQAGRGHTAIIRHGEMLDADGALYTANLRSAAATDQYTFSGDGIETFEPQFTFHGFRYVEVTIKNDHRQAPFAGELTTESITGIVLHSDLPATGTFSCSSPLVDQLQHNIQWGQKGNFVGVPTDCPQRDERLGWTGDAQVFIRTAAFNMQVAGFFAGWLEDLRQASGESGEVPAVVPRTAAGGDDAGPAWADATIICPWALYLCYGDRRILEQHYPAMRRYMAFCATTGRVPEVGGAAAKGWDGFGDWLTTGPATPPALIGAAFHAHNCTLMEKVARVLGNRQHETEYGDLARAMRKSFGRAFVADGALLSGGTQTAQVLALHFDLVPAEQRSAVAAALVRDIAARGMHLSTGFIGTPYIMHVLADMRRDDIASALLMQVTWPSWLYQVTQGATTIWERWDGWTREKGFQDPAMNSFNHYAYGAVGDFLYRRVAGIDTSEEAPGYRGVRLAPRLLPALQHASAELLGPYGLIKSSWRREADHLHWHVVIPANSHAVVLVPTSDPASVRESNQPLAGRADVAPGPFADGALAVNIGSGDYLFTAVLAHGATR